jgi:CBS domain-containing protein
LGIITDRDIAIRAVAKGLDPQTTYVADCMSTDISFVHPTSTIEEVERIMENLQVRRVPVVDEESRVCGMVSMADIARTRPQSNAAVVMQEVSKPTHDSEHAAFLS